jgi:hypothetical protein
VLEKKYPQEAKKGADHEDPQSGQTNQRSLQV